MASKSGWTIGYFSKAVRKDMQRLPEPVWKDFIAFRLMIENEGIHKVPTQYIERIEGDVWELRLRGRGTIARALYMKWDGTRLIILCAFTKKSQHIPRRYIELAKKRAREVRNVW